MFLSWSFYFSIEIVNLAFHLREPAGVLVLTFVFSDAISPGPLVDLQPLKFPPVVHVASPPHVLGYISFGYEQRICRILYDSNFWLRMILSFSREDLYLLLPRNSEN